MQSSMPAAARAAAPRRIGAARLLPAIGLGAAVLLPFLVVAAFPSQDGPAHVNTAQLLAMLRAGEAPTAALFVQEHDPGLTNVAAPWLLSLLLRALPPAQAEWALALGLTLLLLGAVLLGLGLLRGRPSDAAPGLLLCAPVMLYMGSYSLVLGTAFGFAALAFAARHLETGRGRDALLFLGAAVLGCAGNIQVAVPVLAAVFGGVAGSLLWRRLRGGALAPARAELTLIAAALPVVGLALLYRLTMREGQFGGLLWHPQRILAALFLRSDVAWFWFTDIALLGLLAIAIWGLALWWLLRGAPPPGQARAATWSLWAALAVAGLVIVSPTETLTVPQIPMRTAPFVHFLLFLWFCAAPLPVLARRVVVGLALVAGLGLGLSRTLGHAELARRQAELEWAERQIPAGAVVDALRMTWIGAPVETLPAIRLGGFRLRFNPFIHIGHGLDGRDIANLSNYQLMPLWTIFRLRPRPALQEVEGFGHTDAALFEGRVPGGYDGFRARLRAATGRDVDYLVLVTQGVDPAALARSRPVLAAFLADLEAGFERIGRSTPSGLAELWRRRGPVPAVAPGRGG